MLAAMGFGADELRAKALLALEEAVQECRYRKPHRSYAIRFALAYVWSLKPGSRKPYVDLWRALDEDGMFRFGSADQALSVVYRDLGLPRSADLAMSIWKRLDRAERASPKP
jgi:hypothetical protein